LYAGRSKKKLLKQLLPVLIGLNLKAVAFLALASLGIFLVAKKAVLVSLVSIAISTLIAIRKFVSQRSQHPHPGVYESHVGHHGGGWEGVPTAGGHVGSGYGEAGYSSLSSPAAHTLAYGSQKAARK
jgi:hypothetical protein